MAALKHSNDAPFAILDCVAEKANFGFVFQSQICLNSQGNSSV